MPEDSKVTEKERRDSEKETGLPRNPQIFTTPPGRNAAGPLTYHVLGARPFFGFYAILDGAAA